MYNSAFIYFVQTDLFCKEIILLTVALAFFFFFDKYTGYCIFSQV